MYIKDAIYKPIPAKNFTLPVAEGAVVTINGFPAKSDGSDAFGIVPTKIDVIPPTGRVYVAISGTVDLKTCGVTFSDAVIKALGKDFNFVPASEAEQKSELPDTTLADAGKPVIVNETGTGYELGSGGGGLPPFSASDDGKGLFLVKEGEGTTVTVVPEQTVTTDAGGNATLTGVDFSALTDGQDVTIEATVGGETQLVQATYRSADGGGIYITRFELPIITSEGNCIFDPDTTVTISVSASVYSVSPAWVSEGKQLPEVTFTTSDGETWVCDKTHTELAAFGKCDALVTLDIAGNVMRKVMTVDPTLFLDKIAVFGSTVVQINTTSTPPTSESNYFLFGVDNTDDSVSAMIYEYTTEITILS